MMSPAPAWLTSAHGLATGIPDTCFRAPGLDVIVQPQFLDSAVGHCPPSRHRTCLIATEDDANTVDWRPLPIHGIAWLSLGNQSTTRASAAWATPAQMAIDLGPPGENNGRGRLVAGARARRFCGQATAIGAVHLYNVGGRDARMRSRKERVRGRRRPAPVRKYATQ